MAQTAYNNQMTIPADEWTLVSEVDCTIVAVNCAIEIIATSDGQPSVDVRGIPYAKALGEDNGNSILGRYPGAGTADGIYVICRGKPGTIFLSRAAV